MRHRALKGALGEVLRVGIVAGEASGDALGAGLVRALALQAGALQVEGVGGACLREAGCRILWPVERLAIHGVGEALVRLPGVLRLQRDLRRHFRQQLPDLFIGVDAPDFNLPLAKALRGLGIRTAQYVSPSVWAWRPGRVHQVARAVELLLTLFPFEAACYQEIPLRVEYVGHPLAEDLSRGEGDREEARARLGLQGTGPLIGLLPGSRLGELERHWPLFLETARWCRRRRPGLRFAAALLDPAHLEFCRARAPTDLPLRCLRGHSLDLMRAADVLLVASGTATLEAMLLQCPMVVAYRISRLNHLIAHCTRLRRLRYIALPNLLAGRELVPEFIQHKMVPEAMGAALLRWLEDAAAVRRLREECLLLQRSLRAGGARRAARHLLDLLGTSAVPGT